MRRELSILYARFYGFLVVGLIIIYQFTAALHYFIFVIYSFWTCQVGVRGDEACHVACHGSCELSCM